MRLWIVQTVTPILCGLALLLGVIALGRAARASLHDRERYTISFDAIGCEPPPGMSHHEFLEEVRHLSHQPESLHLLDEDVSARLGRAFAAHPWVESVRSVQIRGTARIDLIYRQPVLAVRVPADKKAREGSPRQLARAVDCHGVLLPWSAATSRLPVLNGQVAPPVGAAGTEWGDRRVVAAAATAAFLKPHLQRLRLEACEVELAGGEVVFRKPGVRVVWGHPPGQEEAGEASASEKLRRLLEYQSRHDGLESLEHDVRLVAYQGHFPLPLNPQP